MRVQAAVIGGTGLGDRLRALGGTPVHVPTPFGLMSARIVEAAGLRVAVASRHSAGHKVPPHRVNYRALSWGVRALGARACFATAAVGSLREDWNVGLMAACSDFLDLSGRNLTLFDRMVVHTDFSSPFDRVARAALLEGAKRAGVSVYDGGVYVNGSGPRYETPFEVGLYRKWGGDVVGMTAASEAIAMREAGVPYACLAVVTNLACGIGSSALSHEDVVSAMDVAAEGALAVIREAAAFVGGGE